MARLLVDALGLAEPARAVRRGWALDDLDVAQRLTGDFPAAAASHQHALEQFRDLGDRLGQAEVRR